MKTLLWALMTYTFESASSTFFVLETVVGLSDMYLYLPMCF